MIFVKEKILGLDRRGIESCLIRNKAEVKDVSLLMGLKVGDQTSFVG